MTIAPVLFAARFRSRSKTIMGRRGAWRRARAVMRRETGARVPWSAGKCLAHYLATVRLLCAPCQVKLAESREVDPTGWRFLGPAIHISRPFPRVLGRKGN